jgi:hypothetical protein
VRYFASIDDVRDSILQSRSAPTDTNEPVAKPFPARDEVAEPSFAATFSARATPTIEKPISDGRPSFAPEHTDHTRQWAAALGLEPLDAPSPPGILPENSAAGSDVAALNFSPSRSLRAGEAENTYHEAPFSALRLPNTSPDSYNGRVEPANPSYEDTGHIFPVEKAAPTIRPLSAPQDPEPQDEWAEPFRMLLKRDRTGQSSQRDPHE